MTGTGEAAGSAEPAPLSLRDRESFGHWTEVTLRYVDLDPNGHVNNAVFATLLEAGRVALLYPQGACAAGPDHSFVIVRLVLDFHAELRYPGTAEIGTACLRLGRTSLTLGQGVFKEGIAAASAETVLVLIDNATRRPAPLPPAVTELLAPLLRA